MTAREILAKASPNIQEDLLCSENKFYVSEKVALAAIESLLKEARPAMTIEVARKVSGLERAIRRCENKLADLEELGELGLIHLEPLSGPNVDITAEYMSQGLTAAIWSTIRSYLSDYLVKAKQELEAL
jgi:hypothetical protein